MFLRCKLAFAFIKDRDIYVEHTEIPPIFSSNPGFPLVKFRFSCHHERFEIPNTELILIEIPKSRFKNGNYRDTVNLYAPLFEWLVFDTNQRFAKMKDTVIKSVAKFEFDFEFVSKVLQGCLSFLGLDMFFMVTHLWYVTKDINFEIKLLFAMYQVLQGHLLWLEVCMVSFSD